jgi:hypothetical protein
MDTYSAGTLPRVSVGDNMVGQEVAIWQDITCAEGALDRFPSSRAQQNAAGYSPEMSLTSKP